MKPLITCKNASIRYIRGDFKDIGLKEYVLRKLTRNYHVEEFWAVRHVSFEVMPGEMLGIIGANGAGKSTLLKAVCGIMAPSEGQVRCNARISALLELTSGFDGDLTVLENLYLRAAMLGFSRTFVDARRDEIIDFAELGEFVDRPFKQLSSGMKSRLAFSIASLMDPEVLILDEVLSVGDGAFRKKSEAKMRGIIQGGATTILVSHSLSQVRLLCDKILWLHRGHQVAFGNNVQGLCDAYQAFLDTGKLPDRDSLPAEWVEITPQTLSQDSSVQSAEPAQEGMPAEPAHLDASEEPANVGVPDEPATQKSAPQSSRSLLQTLRSLPHSLVACVCVLLALIAVIAFDEGRLPSYVRALPDNEQNIVMQDEDRELVVCEWESKLYVFMPRDAARNKVFYVHAVDGHGYETTLEYDMVRDASARFSVEDTLVLEVNLAQVAGYVSLDYGLLE